MNINGDVKTNDQQNSLNGKDRERALVRGELRTLHGDQNQFDLHMLFCPGRHNFQNRW